LVGKGKKAALVTESKGMAAPDMLVSEEIVNVLRLPEQLPILLAGPMVRRVDGETAVLWAATSVPVIMRCTITRIAGGQTVGLGEASSIALGDKLFLTLVSASGVSALPRGQLLGYNCEIIINNAPGIVGFDGDVLLSPDEIAYPGFDLPTFFLPKAGKPFN